MLTALEEPLDYTTVSKKIDSMIDLILYTNVC